MGYDITEKTKKEVDIAPTCEVCGKPFDADTAIVRCDTCKTLHHLDCWQYNRGCAVYACNGRMYDRLPNEEQLAVVDPALRGQAPFTVCQPTELIGAAPLIAMIFGVLLSMGAVPAIIKALMLHKLFAVAYVLLGTIGLIVLPVLHQAFYNRLECDPKTGVISRQLYLYNYAVGEVEKDWLSVDDIIEIHFHRNRALAGRVQQQLYLVRSDGKRILLEDSFRQLINGPSWRSTNLEELAQRMAEFSDTTIRLVQGLEEPPLNEVLESARARELIAEKEGEEDEQKLLQ